MVLSYLMGWSCVLDWQVFSCAAFWVVFNTFFARKLHLLEGIVLTIHICASVAFFVTLWASAPVSDAEAAFTQFHDGGGWGNLGVNTLVGITGSTLPLIGADTAAHSGFF
ncbi:hypothetical protein SLS53_006775 [Cytospora paraplurivora]|uniref:Uncharacterized protein n=1 Tax=Cytospora paraplurivora TaxID=2898453 RepID=A0AAN9U2V8_9PEZI